MNIQQLLRQKNIPVTYFELLADHAVDLEASKRPTGQVAPPGSTYVEVRIKELFLQNRRIFHQEFNPLGLAHTRLIFNGDWQDVPYIIGPGLLGEVQQIEAGDQITFLNLRVAGPYPYAGDNLDLFIGLLRVTTKDWAKGMISLAEQVVRSFPLGVLSAYSAIIQPVLSGVQNILAMRDEAELRLGQYISYENLQQGRRHFVIMRPADKLPTKEELWVRDGRLWQGKNQPQIPVIASDFILYSIEALPVRDDWTTLDFHKRFWRPIPGLIQGGQLNEAAQRFNALCVELALCPDLIEAHRIQMMSGYRAALEREWQQKQTQQTSMPWERLQETRQMQQAQLKALADQRQVTPATYAALDATEQLINTTLNHPVALAAADPAETIINQTWQNPALSANEVKAVQPLELAFLLSTDVAMSFDPKM